VVLRGGMETHPVTIRKNVVRENPHWVSVEKFLEGLKKESAS
jgi:hypothetical protein